MLFPVKQIVETALWYAFSYCDHQLSIGSAMYNLMLRSW